MTARSVWVLPSIHPQSTQACLRSINPALFPVPSPPTRQRGVHIQAVNGDEWEDGRPLRRLVVVWNTPAHNLGVAASWNIGVQTVLDGGYDWLTILSAGVRFGNPGGLDWDRWLIQFEAARGPDVLGLEAGNDLGWHLIAFPRHVLERVGYFDPMFWPAYYEDNDYSYRIQLEYGIDSRAPGFVGPLWPKVEVDATLAETAHGVIRGGVHVPFTDLEALYAAKWGGVSPNETYRTPYNEPHLTIRDVSAPSSLAPTVAPQ